MRRSDPEVVQIIGESMGYRGTRNNLAPRFFIGKRGQATFFLPPHRTTPRNGEGSLCGLSRLVGTLYTPIHRIVGIDLTFLINLIK